MHLPYQVDQAVGGWVAMGGAARLVGGEGGMKTQGLSRAALCLQALWLTEESGAPADPPRGPHATANAVPAVAGRSPAETPLLLVEDHADTAAIIMLLLNQLGYPVRHATTKAQALQLARASTPAIVISDLGLPDGTGHDLMRELSRNHQIKGIAMSGYGSEQDLRRSRDAGFEEHITKPIEFADLKAALERLTASP